MKLLPEEDAATRLQAVQRGRLARRRVEGSTPPPAATLEDEYAATRLQAVQRGNLARLGAIGAARAPAAQTPEDAHAATRLQAVHRGKLARRRAMGAAPPPAARTPEDEYAATRLQAMHRGKLSRDLAPMAKGNVEGNPAVAGSLDMLMIPALDESHTNKGVDVISAGEAGAQGHTKALTKERKGRCSWATSHQSAGDSRDASPPRNGSGEPSPEPSPCRKDPMKRRSSIVAPLMHNGSRRKSFVNRRSLMGEEDDTLGKLHTLAGSTFQAAAKRRSSITPELMEKVQKLQRQVMMTQEDEVPNMAAFYSEEGLKQRVKLMQTPAISKALELIWKAANPSGAEAMSEEDYFVMHRKLVLAIDPMTWPQEAMASAATDWQADSDGSGKMDKQKFFWSWFELADLWTESLDPTEYVDFMEEIIVVVSSMYSLRHTTYDLLLMTYYLLRITYSLLLPACYSLLTTYFLLLTTDY